MIQASHTFSLPDTIYDTRAALVHDWLPVYGGAERVLEQVLAVLPRADLFSLIDFLPEGQRDFLGGRSVETSFIQGLPLARRHYRSYLPLVPLAIEGFDLAPYDLVVSSSYVAAKGILTRSDQLHVSYVHSPVRYAWDLQFEYLRDGGFDRGLKHVAARALLHYLRLYDAVSAHRVDLFVANSQHVARRIWKAYRRPAVVVHPPVATESFGLFREKEDFYVTVGRLVPYKRVDLLIAAFNAMPERELVVIGDGPEFGRLERMAGPNVRLLGRQPAPALEYYLQRARAFVFAALEDFGIAPLEAQACGTPTIAYGRGGALETVVPGLSGMFFREQSVASVCEAVGRFEQERFEPERVREQAERFSADRFRERLAGVLQEAWGQFTREGALGPGYEGLGDPTLSHGLPGWA
jgi:glycosyltransferase involved in cell wall biosynthesis